MNGYALLDFGDGRRLERFGRRVFDRPCPSADSVRKKAPETWRLADFRFEEDEIRRDQSRGRWSPEMTESLEVDFGPVAARSLKLSLRGTPFGHLGVFPEQRANWARIASCLDERRRRHAGPLKVLNLFAYTGASSLAAVGPDVEVVHVDSSKSVVERARRNAALNGLERGIRYIVEDARKFVARELKRGNRYDAVILDPPSYGHGLKGEPWKLAEDLPGLLTGTLSLLGERPVFFLLTAHTPRFDADRLHRMALETGIPFPLSGEPISMSIRSEAGERLPCGCGVFFVAQETGASQRTLSNG